MQGRFTISNQLRGVGNENGYKRQSQWKKKEVFVWGKKGDQN